MLKDVVCIDFSNKHPNAKTWSKQRLCQDFVTEPVKQEQRMFQLKIYQLYLSLEYFLLNSQENFISRTQNCLLLHTGKCFQELVFTSLKKHDNNVKYQVRACLAIWGSQQSLCFPWSLCACEPQDQLCRDTLNTLFLIGTTGTATKCRFCIVFKWIFRNANFVLWCYNPSLDLLCWVADSMSVTRKLVNSSICKVPYRKTSLWQCSVFC